LAYWGRAPRAFRASAARQVAQNDGFRHGAAPQTAHSPITSVKWRRSIIWWASFVSPRDAGGGKLGDTAK